MLRNYLVTAIRNLLQHKLFSFINIGGLSIGFAACILIFLFVKNELSYDDWVADSDRVYRLEGKYLAIDGSPENPMAISPGALKAPLLNRFNTEIEIASRMLNEQFLIKSGDRAFLETVNLIDKGFFDIFDLPIIEGDRNQAFQDYQSVIISERIARKYFGDQSPIGETLDLDHGSILVKVVAVMKDLPDNTHLVGDFYLHFDESRYADAPWVITWWTSSNVYTYLKLTDSKYAPALEAAIPDFMDKNAVRHPSTLPGSKASDVLALNLMPITDIHLYSKGRFQQKATGDIVVVYSFSAIAILILAIAIINFTNLSTARASLRSREIALRKVVGASRKQIVLQFLGETFLTTAIALLIAFVLVEISLPWFNDFISKLLDLSVFSDPLIQLGLFGVIVVVGLSAGAHPAFSLSSYQPAKVLHTGSAASAGSGRFRALLTTIQFTISIGLMITTAVIYSQIRYAQTMDTGLDKDNKITLTNMTYGPLRDVAKTVQSEINNLPGVESSVFSSRTFPLTGFWDWPIEVGTGAAKRVLDMEVVPGDFGFLEAYGADLIAGRFFSPDRQADLLQPPTSEGSFSTQSVIINQTAATALGYITPADALNQTIQIGDLSSETRVGTIVGVVKDMQLRSARDTVDPTIFFTNDAAANALHIELHPDNVAETLAQIETVWSQVVPDFPISQSFVDDAFRQFYEADRQRAEMFAYFSLFAIFVSCLGLYGLAAFTTERRTKEIGIRKVMGAKEGDIVKLLTFQFSKPVLLANLISWPIAWFFMRDWLEGFAYRIDLSVIYFIAAGLLALTIACLTVAGHALKVAKANPVNTLRSY